MIFFKLVSGSNKNVDLCRSHNLTFIHELCLICLFSYLLKCLCICIGVAVDML